MEDSLSDLFNDTEFVTTNFSGADSPENLFSILETLESTPEILLSPVFSPNAGESMTKNEVSPAPKRLKFSSTPSDEVGLDGQQRVSHITVERNRRKQMNEHLMVLRSLMPSFYVKRGDQASIIGGVVQFIMEMQQVLQSLEAKKQRRVYGDVLSPRLPRPSPLSPRPLPLSPRPPPLSPRIPISPRTPQPSSPYNPWFQQPYLSPALASPHEQPYISPALASPHEQPSSSFETVKELSANSKSQVANVEVKLSGPNVLLETISHRIPGQAVKIMAAIEGLSLEILQVNINTVDDTMLNSFTNKIGIECKLSVEELAHEIQQTFC
ncbi:transcription factor SPEECHLESS-like isoform X2 [Tasmannia lanceolata]|uniref:transcription factor SPEECHLESS-like isoform X2 n=1 Tax=Tasmannia lanceolata TaxID=3420 RepID=UPI004062B372